MAVLLTLYALAFLDRQIISLMVDPIRTDLGVSDWQIGLLQGFGFALLYAVCGLPLGLAVDRLSRRWVIFGGVLTWALAATACGFARTYDELLAARFLVGAGEAALAPAAFSMLGDLFPKRRLTFALGVYTLGAQVGASASLAIGGLILQAAEGGVTLPLLGHVSAWRFAFIITGLPGIALAFLIFAVPEPHRRTATSGRSDWAEFRAFMRSHAAFFACHFIGFASIMAIAYARLAWAPAYLVRRFDRPIAEVGLTLAAFGLVIGLLSLPTTGALVDRWFANGTRDAHLRYYCWGAAVATIFGAASFAAPSATMFFAISAVASVPLGMAAIAAGAVQIVTPAHLRGRVSAVYLAVTSLMALSAGPALVGLLTDRVFADATMIHWSLAATTLVFGVVAFAAFALGLAPMRRAAAGENMLRRFKPRVGA